ncbi:hypothetical protein [Flavobacterium coralii]|uniref:hypothetical protein n=1 Tax=Flavobacterium coralii TaxID=2838017 RepID=UPI000C3A3BBC|nr:hypothetical protein [Flavobacterium sp.]|tara:strand:+ start:81944 stop:82357 length:414 start_codon:yes stop_codon:yes gene_type:complete
MTTVIKKYYEAFMLLVVLIAFLLFRKEVFEPYVYLIAAAAIALYFVPVRLVAAIASIDTKQTGVQVTSSFIIAGIIAASLVAVSDKNFPGLSTILYGLAIINIFFMIYSFFKDQERKAFLLHFIMIILISWLLNFIG